jgi:hypothetical protein
VDGNKRMLAYTHSRAGLFAHNICGANENNCRKVASNGQEPIQREHQPECNRL